MVTKKLLWPIFKKYFRLFLAMVITSALGIAILVGLWGVYSSLKTGVYGYIEKYNTVDALIQTSLSSKDLSALDELDSIEEYNTRLVLDCSLLADERKLTARVFSYNDDDFLKFYITESKKSDTLINVRVAQSFAQKNNIHAGDELTLYYYNTKLQVCAGEIVSTTECMSMRQNRYINAESSDFGYVYINSSDIKSVNIFDFYNQILIKTSKDYTNEEALSDALEVLPSNLKILDSYIYEDSNVALSININLNSLKNLFTLVPPIFYGITLLIVFLFMVQIMKQERKNAGILKALGFESKDILILYLVIAVIVSVISSILGTLIGYGIECYVNPIYAEGFTYPVTKSKLDMPVVILAAVLNIIVCVLGAVFCAKGIYSVDPVEAMSQQNSDLREPKTLKSLPLPISIKLSISLVLRNAKRFILATICVMFSVMLILCGLVFYSSGTSIKKQTFDSRFLCDATVYLSARLTDKQKEDLEKQEFITEYEAFYVSTTEVSYLGNNEAITLFALEGTKLHKIIDSTGHSTIELPKKGLVLSSNIAKSLGVKKGDIIRLNGKPIEVVEISKEYISPLCYISQEDVDSYNLTCMGGFFCNNTDDNLLTEYAGKMSNYVSLSYTTQLRSYVYNNFDNIYLGVYIVIIFAVLVGFVIIYNVTQINLTEEQRSIAVMRTLGVRMSYISVTWGVELFIQYIIACIFGIALGYGLSYYVLFSMSSKEWIYPLDIKVGQILLSIGIVATFMAASHFISMLHVKKIDLVESTKSKE